MNELPDLIQKRKNILEMEIKKRQELTDYIKRKKIKVNNFIIEWNNTLNLLFWHSKQKKIVTNKYEQKIHEEQTKFYLGKEQGIEITLCGVIDMLGKRAFNTLTYDKHKILKRRKNGL